MKSVQPLFLVVSLSLCFTAARSQETLPESPSAQPVPDVRTFFAGAEAGANLGMSSGSFTAPCACSYESGRMQAAPVAGIFIEHVLDPRWHVSAVARIAWFNQDYTENSQLLRFNPDGSEVMLDIQRNATVRTAYASIAVDAKWYTGLSRLYLSAGPDLGFFMQGSFKDEETILTAGYIYPGTKTNRHVYADKDLKEVYDLESIRLGLRLGAGFDIPLSDSWIVSPEAGYLLALTPVTSAQDSWKLSALQGVIRAKVGL